MDKNIDFSKIKTGLYYEWIKLLAKFSLVTYNLLFLIFLNMHSVHFVPTSNYLLNSVSFSHTFLI